MLKRLRIKFILINMSIVMVMLFLIFSLMFVTTKRDLEKESVQMMNTIARNPMSLMPPNGQRRDVRLPYFSILVSPKGEVMDLGGGFFDLSDKTLLDEILTKTNSSASELGVLKEYNLRFLRLDTPMGQSLVFADISNETAILRSLIRTFVLTGFAAFLLFFCISVLLAKWAVKPVEKAWEQQKQFVADASHELKTPLTVIMTDAELLSVPECLEGERGQLTESILTMSGQMRGLVESLLELAKIDSGSLRGEMSEVSFSDIVQEEAMMFEPLFFEKEMPFSYKVEPKIVLSGNEAHLRQLVDNLLDNAAKYAKEGGATVLTLRKTTPRRCVLSVSNEGKPIKSSELNNLFRRFYRVDKARTSSHSYGLGLSIVKSIAEEHHGRIWAESKDGHNTFFLEVSCR